MDFISPKVEKWCVVTGQKCNDSCVSDPLNSDRVLVGVEYVVDVKMNIYLKSSSSDDIEATAEKISDITGEEEITLGGTSYSAISKITPLACESSKDEFEVEQYGKDEIYTFARLALLSILEILTLCDTNILVFQNCQMEYGDCQLTGCKDSKQPIVGFKNDQKTCECLIKQKTKKQNKYCGKREEVISSCPYTCDTCASSAPTNVFVCEGSTFKFSIDDADNPTHKKYTCQTLDLKKKNRKSILTLF